MRRTVDNLTLARWREVDAASVLEQLGCYFKLDSSFEPASAFGTQRMHVNADGVEFELLVDGPKFFDTRTGRGGGGAVDLVMHIYSSDFRFAVKKLHSIL